MGYGRCLRDTCEMPLRIPSGKNVEETFTSHLFLLLTRSMGSIRRWVSSWICLRSSANFSDRSWDRRFVENSYQKKNYRPKHVFIELQQATRISRYLWLISTSSQKHNKTAKKVKLLVFMGFYLAMHLWWRHLVPSSWHSLRFWNDWWVFSGAIVQTRRHGHGPQGSERCRFLGPTFMRIYVAHNYQTYIGTYWNFDWNPSFWS